MSRHTRLRGAVRFIVALLCVAMAAPVAAQVIVQQVDVNAARAAQNNATRAITESDYILGSQTGSLLLNPSITPTPVTGVSQARALQFGNVNVSNIDMAGIANIAAQTLIGNQNTVNQQQFGNRNVSSVNVVGSGNNVATQQQDVNGAAATVIIRGDNNSISTEQVRSAMPISVTQVGNGGNVSVSVSRK